MSVTLELNTRQVAQMLDIRMPQVRLLRNKGLLRDIRPDADRARGKQFSRYASSEVEVLRLNPAWRHFVRPRTEPLRTHEHPTVLKLSGPVYATLREINRRLETIEGLLRGVDLTGPEPTTDGL